jgi:hypothetical protein
VEHGPFADGGITVVLKYDKDYAAPWATFRGDQDEVRRGILAFVGLDEEDAEGLSLADVVLNASQHVKALGTTGRSLGATVVRPPAAGTLAACDDVWDQVGRAAPPAKAEKPAEPSPVELMLKRIESTGDISGLQRLWAENRNLFDENGDLLSAWKARGRAIKEVSQ